MTWGCRMMRYGRIRCPPGRRCLRLSLYIFIALIILVSTLQMREMVQQRVADRIITDDCVITDEKVSCEFGNSWGLSGKLIDSTSTTEVKHIAFLKVHKVASSTVMNIFMRFGYKRNLTFVLPKNSPNIISQNGSLQNSDIYPPIAGNHFDILCHHVVFNKIAFQHHLYKDAVYVSIIRDPFHQFASSFHYYRKLWGVPYLQDIFSDFPMSELLRHPNRYEPKNPADSFTNNRMAFDMGFPLDIFNDPSSVKIEKYLSHLDSSFHFVMLMEYFDESVVLLRHVLNWSMEDILYVRQNTRRHYQADRDIQPGDRLLHRQRAPLDYALYEHFLFRFWERVHEQGPEFHSEVMYFRQLRGSVETFCRHVFRKNSGVFTTHTNTWHKSFTVNKEDCFFIMMTENDFSTLLKEKQYPYLRPTRQRRPQRKRSRKRVLNRTRISPNYFPGPN